MSEKKPATTREALLAELLGDVQLIMDRMDAMHSALLQADINAKATAAAVENATNDYKTTINETVARLRVETAAIISQTTEHAAKSLVGQQTSTLREAATIAIHQALTAEILKRKKRELAYGAAVSAAASFTGTALYLAIKGF